MSQIKCLSLVAGLGVSLTAALTASGVTPVNNDEVRAIVSEMLADAENRSSLLAAGGGGHDGGMFYLADANGNFRLNVGGQIQFRYYLNFRDDDDNVGGPGADRTNDDFESGFQTSNTRLWFSGNIVDPNLYYAIVGNFERDGGDFNLEEAYAGYKWDNGFSLQWGQFVLPFLREKLVNQWYQLAADRSLTDLIFDQGYSQGIQLGYAAEEFRAMLAFSDGFRSEDSEFGSVNSTNGNFGFTGGGAESDWAITARAEIKFAGAWDQFKDFTSMPESQFAAMLGIAGHIEGSANDILVDGGDPTDPTDDFEAETRFGGWTVDLSLEGDGWNIYLAGNGAYTDNSSSAGSPAGFNDSRTDYGLVAQGGFFFPDTDWELFARYDGIFADDDRNGGGGGDDNSDSFSTVTVGTNYYWSGHAAKFTFDVQYFIDNANDNFFTALNREIGYLGSQEDGEVTLRFQFQLLF